MSDALVIDGRDATDDAVDIFEVMKLLGVSEASVWRGVRAERLPQPFYPQPRSARWIRKEIVAVREQLRMSPQEAMRARMTKTHTETADAP